MGLSSTLIYTSELIFCSTICVPSATRHNIQSERILQYVSSASCKRLSNSLTAPLSISQKMSLFLQDVSAPSPAGAKINELSSMTTYSVPKISFCPNLVEMNSEKTLDLPLMAYVPVCGRRTPVMTAFISIFGFRYGIIVTNVIACEPAHIWGTRRQRAKMESDPAERSLLMSLLPAADNRLGVFCVGVSVSRVYRVELTGLNSSLTVASARSWLVSFASVSKLTDVLMYTCRTEERSPARVTLLQFDSLVQLYTRHVHSCD